jgi:DnaJ-class molecular chaperone
MTEDKKITPAYIPVKCPVCNGFGKVNWGKQKCHACKGKGYILVPAKEVNEK